MNDVSEKAPFLLAVLNFYKSSDHRFSCGIFNDEIFIKCANNDEKIIIDYKNDYKEFLKDIKHNYKNFLKDIKHDDFDFNDIFITTNEYIAAARLVLLNNRVAETLDVIKDVRILSGAVVVEQNGLFKYEKAIIKFEYSLTVMFEYKYIALTTSTYKYKINQIKKWSEKKKLLN